MHNIKKTFDKIYMIISNLLKDSVDIKGNFPKTGRTPKFSDTEIIALSITYLSIVRIFSLLSSIPNIKSIFLT